MGQNGKKFFERVIYASETIQNCKNPTGHIDTLRVKCMIFNILHVFETPYLHFPEYISKRLYRISAGRLAKHHRAYMY